MAEDRPPATLDVTRIAVLPLDARTYARSALHADARLWVEKNCYVDVWIEAVHALGLEPHAMLPFVVALDFEGDQWTFFKPPHDELRALYGIDVQELNVWRPLVEHAIEHLGAGKMISTEADAFWLPDTSGTDYRRQHTKSTIIVQSIDLGQRRLGYFHNAGYFELEGEDFERLFRIGAPHDPTFMPLFAELVRIDRLVRRPPAELAAASLRLLAKHLARRASGNPVERFRARFERDLPALQSRGLGHYHAWAFATTRQFGAAAELAALYLRWIDACGLGKHDATIAGFEQASAAAKTFILKGARTATSRKPFDGSASFDAMSRGWQGAIDALGSEPSVTSSR